MGTAITERQMQLVKRFTPNVVLALDADNAGSEATLRAVGVAAGRGRPRHGGDARLAAASSPTRTCCRRTSASPRCPEGEDPDSLVRADPEALRALIEAAKPVADHLFDAIGERTDLENPRARSQAVEALAPTVAAMTDPNRAGALPAAPRAPRPHRRERRTSAAGASSPAEPPEARAVLARAGGRRQAAAGRGARLRDKRRRVAAAAASSAAPRLCQRRSCTRSRHIRGHNQPATVRVLAGARQAR